MRFKLPITLSILVMTLGCSAAKTTFMHVDDSGNLCASPEEPVKGVPAMVKVPTHIEVEIIETVYWKKDSDGNLAPIKEATCRRASVNEVRTNRLVFVDPKRPISGLGSFNVSLTHPGQVIASINYEAKDETLANSALLAANVAKLFAKTETTEDVSSIVTAERTVAFKRFPIQSEIDAFLTQGKRILSGGGHDV